MGLRQGDRGGYADGTFAPNRAITREQLAAILYRYAKANGADISVGEDTNLLSYKDFQSVGQYAVPALQWAVGSGLIGGTTNATLSPKGDGNPGTGRCDPGSFRRNDRREVISPVPLHRLRPWAGPVFPREAVGTEKSVFSGEKPGKYG